MKEVIVAMLGLFTLFTGATAQNFSSDELSRRAIHRRAVEAVIWAMPAVNTELMLQAMLETTSARPNQVVYWGRALDWHNQTLTPNPDTLYLMAFFDTRDGPIVIEIPAANGGSLNGNIVTVWQNPLEDVGLLGIDKGAGAKFAILPPGHSGAIPAGVTPLQSDTYSGYALLRANMTSHAEADVAESIEFGKKIKVYPLAAAANPPPTIFTDAKDALFDSTIRFDSTFFDHLNRVVQREPWLPRDRAMIDQLRTLGIEKGKPFKPNTETRLLLDAAAVEARAFLDAKYDTGWGKYFEGTQWMPAGAPEFIAALSSGYAEPNSYPTDLRGVGYTLGYVGIKRLGRGQFYLLAPKDKTGAPLDGSQVYHLRVPPNAPVEQYWSATAYDRQTHGLIKNMTRASRASNSSEVKKNPDGSVDIYFGPKAPTGKESNWVPTDPARRFEVMFRLYGPTQALFDKTWALPDVEPIAVQ